VIFTAATPQYVDPLMNVVRGLPGLAYNTTINGMVTPFGAPGLVPFLPRTSIPIDSIIRADARLTKVFRLPWESTSIALAFEAFNVFNQISNTAVNQYAYQAIGTIISPLPGVGVGTASGGYPDGTNARRAQASLRFTF
jgi:hypothetical protein